MADQDEQAEISSEDLRYAVVAAEMEAVRRLAEALGGELVGETEDWFDERLADLYDDDRFKELLGRYVQVSALVLKYPEALERMASSGIPASPTAHEVLERLRRELDPLGDLLNEPAELAIDLHQLPPLHGPRSLGQDLVELVYDPAASPAYSRTMRGFVRMVARVVAVRHLYINHQSGTPAYLEGLFADSEEDVRYVGSLVAATLDVPVPLGWPILDLERERLVLSLNRWRLRRAIANAASGLRA